MSLCQRTYAHDADGRYEVCRNEAKYKIRWETPFYEEGTLHVCPQCKEIFEKGQVNDLELYNVVSVEPLQSRLGIFT